MIKTRADTLFGAMHAECHCKNTAPRGHHPLRRAVLVEFKPVASNNTSGCVGQITISGGARDPRRENHIRFSIAHMPLRPPRIKEVSCRSKSSLGVASPACAIMRRFVSQSRYKTVALQTRLVVFGNDFWGGPGPVAAPGASLDYSLGARASLGTVWRPFGSA